MSRRISTLLVIVAGLLLQPLAARAQWMWLLPATIAQTGQPSVTVSDADGPPLTETAEGSRHNVVVHADRLPVIPEMVTSFGAAVLGDALYVYGGHQGAAHAYSQETQAHTLRRLDLRKRQAWQTLGDGPGLQGLAMVAHGGKLYRLGGFTAKNKAGEEQDLWSQADVACFDPATAEWSQMSPLPEPRSSFDAAVLGDRIYVVGGWKMAGEAESVWHQTAYVLDVASDAPQWKPLTEPPFQRRALSVAVHNGQVYAIGGMQQDGGPTTRVDIFDPATDTWCQGPNLQGEKLDAFGTSSFATGGRLYVSTYSGKLQRLAADGASWEVVAELERARFFHRMLPLSNTELISVGGANMQEGKFEEVDVIDLSAVDSWTGFQNGGVVTDAATNLASEWSPSSGIAWQAKLAGYGQSSPVVNGEIIYVTSTSDDMKEALYVEAFHRATGKQLWVRKSKNSSPAKNTTYVSRAAPSPTCDAAGVIALFEGGNLVALDRAGQPRWTRDLVADFGAITSRHGLGASLEQDETHVFAWIQRDENPFVIALSKETGETVWKSDGLGVTSWSSPRLVPVENGRHLVLSGIGKIGGLDPASGKLLWTFEAISGNSTPTPFPLGQGRFLIGATEGRGEPAGGRAAESNGVIQVSKDAEGKFAAEFVWRAKKATCSFGSPIAHKGHAYFVNRSGVIYCLDVETGEQRYAERSAESIWATPIAASDRLYLFGKGGTTTVIKSGAEFEQLAANKLWSPGADASAGPQRGGFGGPVLYAAVAVESQLILRRGDVLYAVGR